MRIGIIIFARSNSSRLPNKALLNLSNGKKLIEVILNNLNNNDNIQVILATSNNPSDNELVDFVSKLGYNVFRGDLLNVARRAKDCYTYYNLDYFIRVNGDSPFISYSFLKKGIQYIIQNNNVDFVTNLSPRTFPYGISMEIISTKLFSELYSNFNDEEKEHITKRIYNDIKKISYVNIYSERNYNTNLTLTIDTYNDYIKLNKALEMDANLFNRELHEIIKIYEKLS
jgi:spore coat polysaccharide biosynthesis protein SpsF